MYFFNIQMRNLNLNWNQIDFDILQFCEYGLDVEAMKSDASELLCYLINKNL